jgi:transcription elongation factor Elf1
MNCPRCSSLAFYEEYLSDSGEVKEWMISCSICGFHSSQFIESFHNGVPIYGSRINTPLGVVVTVKGNIPYYTKEQKERHLVNDKARGYTFFDGVNWAYTKKEVYSPVSVRNLETEHQE